MKTLTAGFASALALSFFTFSLQAETLHWRGTSSDLASVAANWSPEQVPTAADDIVLDADSANKPLTWDLDVGVASWTQSDYTGTVTFQTGKNGLGWNGSSTVTYTCHGVSNDGVKEFPVAGNLTIASGKWTQTAMPAMSSTSKDADHYKKGYGIYRLIVRVGGSCEIGNAATFDVTSKGFAGGNYPGPGHISLDNTSACHGGMGAGPSNAGTIANTNSCYGSVVHPISQGTARSTAGGGNIDLIIDGLFSLDGKLLAESNDHKNYPGAGGGIYVKCGSLSLGDDAVISANSGTVTGEAGSPGGGGRVAVIVETGMISNANIAKMTANAGRTGHSRSTAGTVFVQDASGSQLIIRGAKTSGSGVTPVRDPSELPSTLKRISLEGAAYLFIESGMDLTVGEIAAAGVSGGTQPRLRVHGGSLGLPETTVFDGLTFMNYYKDLSLTLADAGTLTVTNGASISLNSPTTINGSLDVFGSVKHSTQPSAMAYTNRLDLTVTGDMTIRAYGDVDVTMGGYPKGMGPGDGSSSEYGGTYGGLVPGSGKNVYGSILHPTDFGSNGSSGGAAGAVKLTVGGTLTVEENGWIRAYGNNNDGGSDGSGGSVWLTVGEIRGKGRIDAKGGSYNGSTARARAGGSGGRIAVRQTVGNLAYAKCSIGFYYGGGSSKGGAGSGSGTFYWETAADGLDKGVVSIGNNQLPPEGMPADELTNATIQVGAKSTLTLLDDAYVGQFNLPADATLKLSGHTLHVLNPTQSYSRSIKGTVDDSEGGSIEWPRKGLVLMVR